MSKISEIIRNKTAELKATQDVVGEAISVKPKTFGSWESGRTEPPLETFAKLIKYLGLQNVVLEWINEQDVEVHPNSAKEQSYIDETNILAQSALSLIKLVVDRLEEPPSVPNTSGSDTSRAEDLIGRFLAAGRLIGEHK